MNYPDLMQKAGKRINPKVYYFNDNEKIEYGYDDIISAKPFFNAKLVGTVMKGLELELKYELPNTAIYFENTVVYGQDSATQLFGPYFLQEKATFNADSKTYSHKLYDNFVKTMVPYKPINISYPTTVFEFFKQLTIERGFKTDITSLPNGNRIIDYDLYANIDFTDRDVYEDIGQATGTLLKMDNDTIKKCSLNSTNEIIIDDDILKNENINLGEHFGPINSIILSRSGDSDFIYKRDETLTEWNEYKISDNQLMNNNNRADYLDELYNALYGIEYDIFDLELVGYGGFEPLQKIKIVTNNQEYYSYVFNNEQEYTQGYSEAIYTELPEETNPDYTVSDITDKRINQTYIIVNKQNQTIESVVNQVDNQNEKISQVTQTVDELNSKIQNIADITISDSTLYGNLELNNINASEPINIVIRPIGEDISYLYPNENLFPSETLFMKQRTLRFHNKKTDEDIDYELPDDLLYYDANNYDEFRLDYDTQICQVIKKVEYNADGTKRLLTLPETRNYEYPTINLTDGDYEIILLGYESAYLSVRLMAANIYTTQFATKIELNSSINQLANQIELKVSEKLDKDEIIVSLNLAVENDLGIIEIKGNHVIIDSDNFKLDKLGNITAKDASLTNVNINNGNINITDQGRGSLAHIELNSTGDFASKLELNSYSTTRTTTFGRNTYKTTDSSYDGIRMYVGDEYSNWNTNCNLRPQGLFVHSSYIEDEGIVAAVSSTGIYTLNNDTGDQTTIVPTEVRTPKLTQTSLESQKKNIKIFNNALSIIEDIDIYKYNLKSEDDNHKKHIGFVIGKDYKYSSEITAIDDKGKEIGVDTYSMSSLNTQAIKELLERIKVLERKVENG